MEKGSVMKVLITGGTGMIGSALTDSLVRDGHAVVILSRDPANVKNSRPGVNLAKWDARTADGWGHLVEDVDAIVNLAGESLAAGLWTAERKQRILSSRVNAGRAITQALEKTAHKPTVLIQASGVGYYGVNNPALLDESSPLGDDFLAGVSREWEASTQPVEALGVRRVVIRSGAVFAKKGGALPLMLLPFRLFVGGPLGSGRQWLPWIHIEDEVRAIRFLIDNEQAYGAVNLAAQSLTNAEFSRTAGKELHRQSFLRVPAFLLKLVLGEMSTTVLDGQRISSRKLTDLGFEFRYPGLEEALESLVR
jgi:hypothetical protein